jgi:hypothetical protein
VQGADPLREEGISRHRAGWPGLSWWLPLLSKALPAQRCHPPHFLPGLLRRAELPMCPTSVNGLADGWQRPAGATAAAVIRKLRCVICQPVYLCLGNMRMLSVVHSKYS